LNSIPFGVAMIAMVIWGRSSDHFNDRLWHTFIPLVLSGLALCGTIMFHSLTSVIVILTLALIGTYAAKGPFWAMVTEWLPAEASATGIGMVSAVGSIAAAVSTYLLGVIQKETGSFTLALMPLIILAAVASVVLVIAGMRRQTKLRLALLKTGNGVKPSERDAQSVAPGINP
jgi:ACS family tartrate transporter-like MFS transporter